MKQLLLSFAFFLTLQLSAQNTDISGTINDYASVTNIAGNTVTVNSSAGFAAGDLALIIQMQGATMDETNTAAFGDVVNINSAGNYELVQVCGVPSGTELSISTPQRMYDPAGVVQIIRVPDYNQATITADLTANAWDGTTGGVLAIKCRTLIMNAGINLQATGFDGGQLTTSTFACQWFFQPGDFFYDITTGEGAMKGEGVANYINLKTGGKGAQVNGGGGGNDHNAGGGGGANAGAGGQGGERVPEGLFFCSGTNPGLGGKANTYSNAENKIFMGGGGGAGHENNVGLGTSGARGGGIVIILADSIVGNSQTIDVRGADGVLANDGAGGGGAGGTVLIDCPAFDGGFSVDASGANGGDVDNIGPSNCNGPGGGGGGGMLWVSEATIPGAITYTSNAGANGNTVVASQTNCSVGNPNGATAGAAGGSLTDLVIQLPVTAEGVDVQTECDSLTWIDGITYYADNNTATFTIVGGASSGCDSIVNLDLTIDAGIDTSVTQLEAFLIANGTFDSIQWYMSSGGGLGTDPCGGSGTLLAGETNDSINTWNYTGGLFYGVLWLNGCSDSTACFYQIWESIQENGLDISNVYPNPTNGRVIVELGKILDQLDASLLDMRGREVGSWSFTATNEIELHFEGDKGVYILNLESEGERTLIRLLKD